MNLPCYTVFHCMSKLNKIGSRCLAWVFFVLFYCTCPGHWQYPGYVPDLVLFMEFWTWDRDMEPFQTKHMSMYNIVDVRHGYSLLYIILRHALQQCYKISNTTPKPKHI